MGVERYQRERLLAEGLMSEVWLARDTLTRQLVVLKIMTTIAEDEKRNVKARERFLREIDIAKSLRHPHVLPLLDDGEMLYKSRVVPYLVSPYIRDGSLADLVKKSPPWERWSLPQTADVIMQAAESLYYLHTRHPPIVHQDVKPNNFLYQPMQSATRVAHIYLCDFGISRLQGRFQHTASELLGTFAYMAPEQAARQIDPASDQYALAVMACYLLTGKLPLSALTNEEYIQAHLHEQPRLPGELNPQRIDSPAIDAALLRALAKKPAQRFPTIVDFARALQEAVARQTLAHANARTERFDPAYAATLYPVEKPRAVPTLPTLPAVARPEPEEHLLPLAIEPLDTYDENRVLDEPLPGKQPEKAPIAANTTPLLPLSLRQLVRYDLSARPRQLIWSPDGACLACIFYNHLPLLLCRDGSMQEVRTQGAEQANNCCWSATMQVLAISVQGEIRFWDSGAQALLPLLLPFAIRSIEGLDWSRQGQLAVWIEQQLLLYQLSDGSLRQQRPPAPHAISTGAMRCGGPAVLRWSPGGALLAAGALNGEVLCWNPAYPSDIWRISSPGQKVNALAWSPDGSILAVAYRDNRVVGWNTHTRERLLSWEQLPAMPRALSISSARRITIATSEQRLLSGLSSDAAPSAIAPGQLLAAWSPMRPELATLDEQHERTLVIWRES